MSQISQHFKKIDLGDEDTKYQLNRYLENHPNLKVSKISFNRPQGTCVEDLFVVFDVIEPKKEVYINVDKLSELFAGHSDYHGDTILSLISCVSEGKEVSSARPLDTDRIKLETIKEYQKKLIYEIVNRSNFEAERKVDS